MKKPVIFIDLGDVFFRFDHKIIKRAAEKIGISEGKIKKALWVNWKAHAEGKISEKYYWRVSANELGVTKKQAEQLRKALYSALVPQDGMQEVVRKLRKNYRVVVLSSQITGWTRALEKKYRFSREFHEHHYSYDHGVDKPDVRLFLKAAKKMKVKPQECIVIDDMKKFLSGVKKTGARTILFKNVKQLESQLRKLGV
ncbi:MAG: HAD-IA family hydrolase [Candidatus Aenigmarchaeota archaeon]|nr:HAD-IA family hydrolase [Candidatus Aenigmarchaeota archaeon]